MTNHNQPIGVFDSGVGGLTVLRAMYRQLPDESVLYFGDTARLPYGTRSPQEILQFVREILLWMAQSRVKMAIVACNTSSALALEAVRCEFDFPILGLILPGARGAVGVGQRIGVIATPATAASGAYRRAILEMNPSAEVWEMGCPEFVPLIEGNRIHTQQTREIIREYLEPLLAQKMDTLVYGCTHYPLLEPVLRQLLPPEVTLVDPATYVVQAAAQELDLLGLRATPGQGSTQFGVSGCPNSFATLSQQWLGFVPHVHHVVLPPVLPITDARPSVVDEVCPVVESREAS
ncbi:glutamate racemase [Phormidium yuhuli AB48]|uniref:Glutamate racemase n=1 Tax=Phormidium yuhuli AB48 TaxID=2940671 RepID=A0ABY5ARK2_9CYAN|nr:glutamate racemase [Phormidium yuhuli]USR90783.1 glutamate racemase [Phormidium yuhuli AB48]